MKRVTVLTGFGTAGKIKLTIESDSKETGLMRDEHEEKHSLLVESAHKAMTERGCYAHKIKAKP